MPLVLLCQKPARRARGVNIGLNAVPLQGLEGAFGSEEQEAAALGNDNPSRSIVNLDSKSMRCGHGNPLRRGRGRRPVNKRTI